MAKDCTSILIVDDEEIDIAVMRRTLELAGGFTVIAALSYGAAIEVFDEKKDEFDLAIIDVSLPGDNGVDLGRLFLRKRRDLKLLFVSGWVGAELLRTHGIGESDLHFLPKPFRPSELVARVRSVLAEPNGADWLPDSFAGDSDSAKDG